jgi:hypothetical protein
MGHCARHTPELRIVIADSRIHCLDGLDGWNQHRKVAFMLVIIDAFEQEVVYWRSCPFASVERLSAES